MNLVKVTVILEPTVIERTDHKRLTSLLRVSLIICRKKSKVKATKKSMPTNLFEDAPPNVAKLANDYSVENDTDNASQASGSETSKLDLKYLSRSEPKTFKPVDIISSKKKMPTKFDDTSFGKKKIANKHDDKFETNVVSTLLPHVRELVKSVAIEVCLFLGDLNFLYTCNSVMHT